jgi:hypothetical protein
MRHRLLRRGDRCRGASSIDAAGETSGMAATTGRVTKLFMSVLLDMLDKPLQPPVLDS